MPAVSDVEGLPVLSPEGDEIGSVQSVLFHPSEPRAVALEVIPVNMLVVVARKPRYVPIGSGMLADCGEIGYVQWTSKRLPSVRAAEKELGFPVETTVIWHDMEVRLATGERAGRVADVGFSRTSGRVLRLVLSEGSLADFAVGRREVPGKLVKGFDGAAVIIDVSFRTIAPSSGGLAAATAKGSVYAKYGAEKAADKALAATVTGLEMVEESFRSGLGRKAVRGIKRAGKRVRKAIEGEE